MIEDKETSGLFMLGLDYETIGIEIERGLLIHLIEDSSLGSTIFVYSSHFVLVHFSFVSFTLRENIISAKLIDHFVRGGDRIS